MTAFQSAPEAFAAAHEAVAAIADPAARGEAGALLALVEATRALRHGGDPLAILVPARAGLGRIRLPLARSRTPSPPTWKRLGRLALVSVFGIAVMYAVWAVAIVVLHAMRPAL